MRKGLLIRIFVVCLLCVPYASVGQHLAKIFGKVTDENELPIEAANIIVLQEDHIGTSTNEAGRYELLVPHDKKIVVQVSCIGYGEIQQEIVVAKGKRQQLDFTLKTEVITMADFQLSEKYSITDQDLKPINPKTLAHLPGVGQGVEALIKSGGLGVFSSNEMTSQYNVRGGNYDENLIYLNGIEVHRPLLIRSGNQEGLSFVNPDLVSAINFSPGGFDACYGDKMSSVLDVQYKVPARLGGSISASLLGATGHFEGISKDQKFSVLMGARYQSNAYVFNKMQTSGDYRPTFTDVQLLLNYRPSDKVEISLFGNYARNIYRFIPKERSATIGTINDAIKLTAYFEGQEVDAYQTVFSVFSVKHNINENHSIRYNLSYFFSLEKETFDILSEYFLADVNTSFGDDYGEEISSQAVGAELHHGRNFLAFHLCNGEIQGTHHLPKRNTLSWGVKVQGEFITDALTEWKIKDSADYTPAHFNIPGDSVALDDSIRIIDIYSYLKSDNALNSLRTSGFIQNKWTFGGDKHQFSLITGVRFTYWTFNNECLVMPRIRFVYQPQWKTKTSFYAAVGMYGQPPFYKEMRNREGVLNRHIQSQQSYYFILGSDVLFKIATRPFKYSGEIYYKFLDKLISYSLDNVRVIYSAENDARGYAYGLDVKLSGEIVHHLESWISMSIMKSMETFDGGKTYTPRPTDQRISFNLFFQDRVPKLPMLKAHINLVYATALPYSFPTKKTYDRRSTAYFRTDIGFSWQFMDEATRLSKYKTFNFIKAAYLTAEITNLFNYNNILSYTWISDLNNRYYAMPNYLSPRLFNVKIRFEF